MRLHPVLTLAVLIFSVVANTGCVQRKMVITTEPEGAKVVVNQNPEWTGITSNNDKFTINFKHYGVYDIQIEKDGYYPIRVAEPISAPLYQKPGADLISEALVPTKINDIRELHYKLQEIEDPDEMEGIFARSKKMKKRSLKVIEKRREYDKKRKPTELPLPTKEETEERREEIREQRAMEEQKEEEAQTLSPGTEETEELDMPPPQDTGK